MGEVKRTGRLLVGWEETDLHSLLTLALQCGGLVAITPETVLPELPEPPEAGWVAFTSEVHRLFRNYWACRVGWWTGEVVVHRLYTA